MFRELPASRPIRSFRRGEWTGIIGASVLHAGLLLLGAAPSTEPVVIAERDTIPIVFHPERHPSSDPVAHRRPTDDASSLLRPTPVDWPDGAFPEIDLAPDAIELDPSGTPGERIREAGESAPAWAGLRADHRVGAGGVARESALDLPIRFERAPEPRYPEWLRRAGITGVVTVEFIVDTTGRVEAASIEIIQATRQEFAEAVVGALDDARLSPGTVRGRPVRVKVRQDFRFRIEP